MKRKLEKILMGLGFLFVIFFVLILIILIFPEDSKTESFKTNISSVNESKLEDDVFNLINIRRDQNYIENVKRNPLLDTVAKDYAKEMSDTGIFAHEPYEGYGPSERIMQKEIFFLGYSEVISQSYFYGEENFSLEVVDGWISSPGHRSTILDAGNPIYWESVGMGISCGENEEGILCYGVGVFAKLEEKISDELEENYYIAYELYSEGLGYSYPVEAKITFDSEKEMDLILLDSMKKYEVLLDGNSYKDIFNKKWITHYEDTIELRSGYVLVPHARKYDSTYNITILYNQ